jgi:membrane protease YdiL (CAAX protease family)
MDMVLPALMLVVPTVLVGIWAVRWGPPQALWSLPDVAASFLLFIGAAGLSGSALCKLLTGDWVPDESLMMPGVLGTGHAGLLVTILVLRRGSPHALGFVRAPWWGWGAAAAGVPIFLAVSASWAIVASLLGLDVEPQQLLLELSAVSFPDRWALLVYGAMGAPLVEEVLFRGFLLPPLVRRTGEVSAIAMSGALFGIAHVSDPYAIVPLVVLGAGLAWLRIQTKSIWPGVLVHAANNSIALASSLYAPPF